MTDLLLLLSKMNFNSLPNETLQRIVDLCHAGDRAYAARQAPIPAVVRRKSKGLGKVKSKVVSQEHLNYGEWWGRSCSAIPMVNKNLRSMSIKHLFTVSPTFFFARCSISYCSLSPQSLRLSKHQDDIFQYSILGSPAGDCITKVIFDHSVHGEDTSLFTFVCRTLTLLPNVRAVKGLDLHFSSQLYLHTAPSFATTSIKYKRAFDALTRLATQINNWDITLEQSVAELFLSKNYDGIESLTLQSPANLGFFILESNESRFLTLLSNCSNLRHLYIQQTHRYRDQIVDPVANTVLSTSFPFANTLRSLTLDLERKNGRTTANEFEFIALFPSLESLRITFRSTNLDEIESKSFLLPKLSSLKVVDCPFLHIHILICCLNLPSISDIHFEQSGLQDSEPTPIEELDEIRKLVSELGAYSSSLQNFCFTSRGLSQVAAEALSSLQALVNVNSAFVSPSNDFKSRVARRPGGVINLSDSESDYSDEEEAIRIVGTSESARSHQVEGEDDFGTTEKLLEWAHDRFKRCRKVDDDAVEELRKVLEPVKELKEWLED